MLEQHHGGGSHERLSQHLVEILSGRACVLLYTKGGCRPAGEVKGSGVLAVRVSCGCGGGVVWLCEEIACVGEGSEGRTP